MELLINGLFKKGARHGALEAKLFGGARTVDGLSDIGAKNVEFAKRFLLTEGIPLVDGDVGGDRGRRIEYWPHSGRARQYLLERAETPPAVCEPPPRRASHRDLELF